MKDSNVIEMPGADEAMHRGIERRAQYFADRLAKDCDHAFGQFKSGEWDMEDEYALSAVQFAMLGGVLIDTRYEVRMLQARIEALEKALGQ